MGRGHREGGHLLRHRHRRGAHAGAREARHFSQLFNLSAPTLPNLYLPCSLNSPAAAYRPIYLTVSTHLSLLRQVGCLWLGKHLVSLSLNGDLNLLDESAGKARGVLQGHSVNITAMAVRDDSAEGVLVSERGFLCRFSSVLMMRWLGFVCCVCIRRVCGVSLRRLRPWRGKLCVSRAGKFRTSSGSLLDIRRRCPRRGWW